jgi:hypothetical protein
LNNPKLGLALLKIGVKVVAVISDVSAKPTKADAVQVGQAVTIKESF